jgi:hypothetical protein
MNTHDHNHDIEHTAADAHGHKKANLNFFDVYAAAYTRFKKTLGPVLSLWALSLLLVAAVVIFSAIVLYGLFTVLPSNMLITTLLLTLGVLVVLGLTVLGICVSIMNIQLLVHPTYDLLPVLKKALPLVPLYTVVMLTAGLAELGGYILFIIPGFWMSVLLCFVSFIVIIEKKNTHQALVGSAHLVKNNFWSIVLCFLGIILLSSLTELVLYIGWILAIFVGIFGLNVVYELYTRTTEHNTNHTLHSKADTKIITIATIFVAVTVCTILLSIAGLMYFGSDISNYLAEELV